MAMGKDALGVPPSILPIGYPFPCSGNTAGNVIQASATHCFFVVNKIRIIFAATMVQEGIIAKGNTETAASREAHISRCVSACCPPPPRR